MLSILNDGLQKLRTEEFEKIDVKTNIFIKTPFRNKSFVRYRCTLVRMRCTYMGSRYVYSLPINALYYTVAPCRSQLNVVCRFTDAMSEIYPLTVFTVYTHVQYSYSDSSELNNN